MQKFPAPLHTHFSAHFFRRLMLIPAHFFRRLTSILVRLLTPDSYPSSITATSQLSSISAFAFSHAVSTALSALRFDSNTCLHE